MFQDAQAKEKC